MTLTSSFIKLKGVVVFIQLQKYIAYLYLTTLSINVMIAVWYDKFINSISSKCNQMYFHMTIRFEIVLYFSKTRSEINSFEYGIDRPAVRWQ